LTAQSHTRLLLAVAVVAAVGLLAWRLWPSETRRIRQRLDAIVTVVNERPENGVGQIARAVQLSKFVTDDVVLDPGRGAGVIQGRERLIALASRAPNAGDPYRIAFVDVSIDLQDEQSATAHLTATLSSRDVETGEDNVDAREVELQFRHTDDWRVSRITLIDTLEKPLP
jgi:hypothetical protein